jgi:hypothetical protein
VLLTSCAQPEKQTTQQQMAPSGPLQITDAGKTFNKLSAYADDLSSVSKRREVKELPESWDGMMQLVHDEMRGRQWNDARTHLALATKMAPNTASLVLTKGQFAILDAKQGKFDQAIGYLDALIESPEVVASRDMVSAVETLRATITQYKLNNRKMP